MHLQSCLFFGNFAHKLIIIYNKTFMNAFSDGAEIIMRNDVENELAPIDLCEFAFTCNG